MDKHASPPPDQKYRDQIAADLDRTLMVEAGAGTGKTTCLISRMIGLLREGKCCIESLAAVTFTRKAAAELRTRFQLALEKQSHGATGDSRQRLVDALGNIERCFIGTIHSFCSRLLRERPVEAGVNPGFVELEEHVDNQLRQQAWREHVAAMIANDDPMLPELERLGLKISSSTSRSSTIANELDALDLAPAELGPAFLSYAEYPDVVDWPAPHVPMPDLGPCVEALNVYIAHIRSVVLPPEYGNDKLMPLYEYLARMVPRVDLAQTSQLMEVLENFELFERNAVIQKMWPGKKAQALAELERWNEFARNFATPLLLTWKEHRYAVVMRAIQPARDVYDQLRRERNGLNFHDLLLRSVSLLRDNPDVRRYFRERFTHLLVDEFQDTDPIQAEVMRLLSADNIHESDWQKCRPVAGSLFVVGDPKQSIYRFRRADIVTYGKVRSLIENAGGAVIPLTANFRSVDPVVTWVNGCFSQIFPENADDWNPANRPLDVAREERVDPASAIRRLLSPEGYRRNDDIADYEADLIARTIRRAIDDQQPVPRSESDLGRGLPPYAVAGDFLIVAKSKTRLTHYARKLQQYGIPHVVTGGRVLNDLPELEFLQLCLSATARKDDPIALVAALRSPLFGVSDTQLYDFKSYGGRFSYWTEIPASLSQDDAEVFRGAFGKLQTYSGWLQRLPTAAAIERIAADMGLIARACAAEEGNVHAGSFLKAIELLRSMDTPLSVGDYTDALARLIDGEDKHDGAPVLPYAEAPVRVMNLHQCKGLEAPFVFLVDPSGLSEHDVSVFIDRSTSPPKGYLPIYGPKTTQWGRPPLLAHPHDWDVLAAQEQRFLDAETNRLLYVAVTRAGMQLVISQRPDARANEKNPWSSLDHHLQSQSVMPDPGQVTPLPTVELPYEAEPWKTAVAAIESRWSEVLKPSYAVVAVKETAITGGPKPHGIAKDGAEWGDVLHTLLETAMKKPTADWKGLALSALESVELSSTLVDEVIDTVTHVIASELWQRARNSGQYLTEVPLAFSTIPTENTEGLQTVHRGVIDLVFREAAGWVIVDYKSERVDASSIPDLVTYYKPQIEAYVHAWQKCVAETVVERGIFFTQTGEYVRV